MFAVFKTGGKQYRVAAEDMLKVDKVKGEPGEIVEFGEVLVVGGDSVTLGAPTIVGATVAAEVIEQGRGAKIIAFKKRRRKNSRRKIGHRQEFTLLRITEILTEGKKPSKEVQPRKKSAPKPAAAPDAIPRGRPLKASRKLPNGRPQNRARLRQRSPVSRKLRRRPEQRSPQRRAKRSDAGK
ncbi:MAG: 50S ribosomal protein L21 [Xanthobacteraceae bacterium]